MLFTSQALCSLLLLMHNYYWPSYVLMAPYLQIRLNLTHLITLGTKSNLEGFVWSHQSEMGLVSPRQFAPQC